MTHWRDVLPLHLPALRIRGELQLLRLQAAEKRAQRDLEAERAARVRERLEDLRGEREDETREYWEMVRSGRISAHAIDLYRRLLAVNEEDEASASVESDLTERKSRRAQRELDNTYLEISHRSREAEVIEEIRRSWVVARRRERERAEDREIEDLIRARWNR